MLIFCADIADWNSYLSIWLTCPIVRYNVLPSFFYNGPLDAALDEILIYVLLQGDLARPVIHPDIPQQESDILPCIEIDLSQLFQEGGDGGVAHAPPAFPRGLLG